MNNSVMTAGG
jgi:hypothetical protein